jgi:sulfatase modifying factor 1
MLIPPCEGIAKAYYMGKYEVTQSDWEKVMGKNPSSFKKGRKEVGVMDTSRFPVENVSWFDCVSFCNKLSEREGLKPYYTLKVLKETNDNISDAEVQIVGGNGYKLPTEAEWTWGCAAGAKTKYHFGSLEDDLPAYAWFKENSEGRPHAVGEKRANAFGLFDIHGNVNEWSEEMLTKADGAPERVSRGGYWSYHAATCAVGSRTQSPVTTRQSFIGLRVARVP